MIHSVSAGLPGRTQTAHPRRGPWVLASLRGYQRPWLAADALAAITLLVIAVPEQLATSRLAGMPPITGFYAFVAGTVMFAALGSNPVISVGADSTIAPLFAVGVARLAPSGSLRYEDLVGLLAVMVGTLVALVWLLRLGWISDLLSAPIIAGFLAGVAVIIVVHQLPDLLGVRSGGGTTIHRVTAALSKLGHVNGWTLGIGLGVLAVVIAAERVDRRVPGALLGLVGSTALVAVFGLRGHGVAVLGPIAHGAPRFGLTGVSMAAIQRLAPLAGVVALVVVSQTAATSRAFAGGASGLSRSGRDFLGVGAGSILAGLAGAFPVDASPPRTAAVASMRGRTQLAALLAAAGIVLLVPAAGLLRDVPLAALAGVLVYVASRIFHRDELIAIGHFDRFELAPRPHHPADGGARRGRAGDRRRRRPGRPGPGAAHRPPAAPRAGPDPRNHQLGAAVGLRAACPGARRARRVVRDAALVRQCGAFRGRARARPAARGGTGASRRPRRARDVGP